MYTTEQRIAEQRARAEAARYVGPVAEADVQAVAQEWANRCTGGVRIVVRNGRTFIYRMGTW